MTWRATIVRPSVQVFIDDMDRYVFQVAVEDRDMSKILDTDGNAYIGFTASTGSKAGLAIVNLFLMLLTFTKPQGASHGEHKQPLSAISSTFSG
jgi:hypothetical protein